jgi:hypothetical protein
MSNSSSDYLQEIQDKMHTKPKKKKDSGMNIAVAVCAVVVGLYGWGSIRNYQQLTTPTSSGVTPEEHAAYQAEQARKNAIIDNYSEDCYRRATTSSDRGYCSATTNALEDAK